MIYGENLYIMIFSTVRQEIQHTHKTVYKLNKARTVLFEKFYWYKTYQIEIKI